MFSNLECGALHTGVVSVAVERVKNPLHTVFKRGLMNENSNIQPLFHSPRPYLSWSQISLFERSPEWYAKKYLFAQQEEQTDSMRFGKRFAQALELQQKTGDDALDNMVSAFPNYPQREFQIEAWLDGVEVPLYGVLDAFDPETLRIGEFKTGRLWTQEMVNDSGQLKMYVLLVWLKFQQLPSEVWLHWAETQFIEGKGIEFTGEVQQFEANISHEDLAGFSDRVRITWEGIKKLSAPHLQGIR